MDAAGEDHTIHAIAEQCETLFRDYIFQLGENIPLTRQLAQDFSHRFEAWAEYLGVFAREVLSLDHRLRKSLEIKSLVIQQLFVLKRNLVIATELLKSEQHHPQTSHVVEKDGKVTHSAPFKAALDGLQDALDRLHRLGNAIRQVSTSRITPRFKQYYKDKEVDSFEKVAHTVLETMYPSANPSLLEQIKDSLSLKFQKFLYLQGRGEHMTRSSWSRQRNTQQEGALLIQEHVSIQAQERAAPSNTGSEDRKSKALPKDQAQSEAQSSRFDIEDEEEVKKVYGQSSESPSYTTSLHLGYASCPSAPSIPDGENYGTCTWCRQNHPTLMFKSAREWRRHVEKDWEPYICLSADCGTVPASFNNARDWEKHMQERHSPDWSRHIYKNPTWTCDIDHEDIKEFPSQARLVKHLKDKNFHPGFPESDVQTTARRSIIYVKRRASMCPVCCYDIENEREVPTNTTSSGQDLEMGKKQSGKGTNTTTVRFAQPETPDAIQEQTSEEHVDQGPERPKASSHSSTFSEDAKFSLRKRMAKEVAGHLQTAVFCILSIYFLPPEPENDGDGNDGQSWSGRLAQQDSSEGAQSLYQDFFAESETDDIDPEYESLSKFDDEGAPKVSESSFLRQINDAMVLSVFPEKKRRFLPDGEIRKLANIENVASILKRSETNWRFRAGSVIPRCKRIFLLLVWLHEPDLLFSFIDNQLDDSALPISRSTLLGLMANKGLVERFEYEQWSFIAPYIHLEEQPWKKIFSTDHILPFIVSDMYKGVHRVVSHPDHAIFTGLPKPKDSDLLYRLQPVRNPEDKAHMRVKIEEMLDKQTQRVFRHAVPVASWFEIDRHTYLLRPWATGNMYQFMESQDRVPLLPPDSETFLWGLKQCYGFISMMQQMEGQYFLINPLAIYSFVEEGNRLGILKLDTISLPKISPDLDRHYETHKIERMGLYEFPDDLGATEVSYLRRSWIRRNWSVGCLVLDLVLWHLDGYAAVSRFRKSPPGEGRKTHSEENRLYKHPFRSQAIVDVIKILRNDLMFRDPAIPPLSMNKLCSLLETIIQQCSTDWRYQNAGIVDEAHASKKQPPITQPARSSTSIVTASEQNHKATYYLAPFRLPAPPLGPLRLGSILLHVDISHPVKQVLNEIPIRPERIMLQSIKTTNLEQGDFQRNLVLTKLEELLLKGGVKHNKSTQSIDYSKSTIDTEWFLPDAQYISSVVQSRDVKRYLESTKFRKPLYLVTGIKVIRGTAETLRERNRREELQMDLPGDFSSIGVPIGISAQFQHENSQLAFSEPTDFVLGFKVHKIWHKTRIFSRKTSLRNELYTKGAMLSDETMDTDQEIELGHPDEEDLEGKVLVDGGNDGDEEGMGVLWAIPKEGARDMI